MRCSRKPMPAPSELTLASLQAAHERRAPGRRGGAPGSAGRVVRRCASGRGGAAGASQYRARGHQQRTAPESRGGGAAGGRGILRSHGHRVRSRSAPGRTAAGRIRRGASPITSMASRAPKRCRTWPSWRAWIGSSATLGRSGAADGGSDCSSLQVACGCSLPAPLRTQRAPFAVDELRAAILAEDLEALRAVPLERAEHHHALWRSEAGVNVRSVSAASARFLDAALSGAGGAAALAAAAALDQSAEELSGQLARDVLAAGSSSRRCSTRRYWHRRRVRACCRAGGYRAVRRRPITVEQPGQHRPSDMMYWPRAIRSTRSDICEVKTTWRGDELAQAVFAEESAASPGRRCGRCRQIPDRPRSLFA